MSDKMVSANMLFSSTRSLLPLYPYASTMFQQNIAGKARVLGDAVGIPKYLVLRLQCTLSPGLLAGTYQVPYDPPVSHD
eukprot:scaffold62208_cov58-Attheya_sp.AAC.3